VNSSYKSIIIIKKALCASSDDFSTNLAEKTHFLKNSNNGQTYSGLFIRMELFDFPDGDGMEMGMEMGMKMEMGMDF
jgi:hypothetical protein